MACTCIPFDLPRVCSNKKRPPYYTFIGNHVYREGEFFGIMESKTEDSYAVRVDSPDLGSYIVTLFRVVVDRHPTIKDPDGIDDVRVILR